MIHLTNFSLFEYGKTFVSRSAILVSDFSKYTSATPLAIDDFTFPLATEQCFFFKTEFGKLVLTTTDLLSQNILAGPLIGMPNILNLYLKPSTNSIAIFKAIISDEKVEVSTVFCRLENQIMGEQLQYITIPV